MILSVCIQSHLKNTRVFATVTFKIVGAKILKQPLSNRFFSSGKQKDLKVRLLHLFTCLSKNINVIFKLSRKLYRPKRRHTVYQKFSGSMYLLARVLSLSMNPLLVRMCKAEKIFAVFYLKLQQRHRLTLKLEQMIIVAIKLCKIPFDLIAIFNCVSRILLLEAGGENPLSIYGSVPAFAIFMQKGEADWQYVTEGHESAMGHLQDGVSDKGTTRETDGKLTFQSLC